MVLTRIFSKKGSPKYTTSMTDSIPDLPGYVSTREAAKILGVSERRIRLYIEMKRLPAVRAADVLMLPLEEVKHFQRKIIGRPRINTPAWRISASENTQFFTTIAVQLRAHQEKLLLQRLAEIRQAGQYIFPGTVARYIVRSATVPGQVEITLVWRKIIMPNEIEREQALEAFRRALADVLDWSTAQYSSGEVLMHT
jgi:hypothetical protein